MVMPTDFAAVLAPQMGADLALQELVTRRRRLLLMAWGGNGMEPWRR